MVWVCLIADDRMKAINNMFKDSCNGVELVIFGACVTLLHTFRNHLYSNTVSQSYVVKIKETKSSGSPSRFYLCSQ